MTGGDYEGYLRGSILKYLWRYPLKGGSEDLEKAQKYLGWLIDFVQKKECKQSASAPLAHIVKKTAFDLQGKELGSVSYPINKDLKDL